MVLISSLANSATVRSRYWDVEIDTTTKQSTGTLAGILYVKTSTTSPRITLKADGVIDKVTISSTDIVGSLNVEVAETIKGSSTIIGHAQVYQLKVTSPTILFGGQIHYSSVTNINTQNVYERVAGTSTFDTAETSWFDMPDNNQWRYRDDRTKHFRIMASGYYRSVAGSDTFEFSLYKNGVQISKLTEQDGRTTAVDNNEQFMTIGATTLATNDIVDVRVKNKTGDGDVAFVNYTILISPNH